MQPVQSAASSACPIHSGAMLGLQNITSRWEAIMNHINNNE